MDKKHYNDLKIMLLDNNFELEIDNGWGILKTRDNKNHNLTTIDFYLADVNNGDFKLQWNSDIWTDSYNNKEKKNFNLMFLIKLKQNYKDVMVIGEYLNLKMLKISFGVLSKKTKKLK